MFRIKFLIFFIPAILIHLNLSAQGIPSKRNVQYETVYDDPYDIKTLYVKVNPAYGEVFSTNNTIGFGLEVDYYLKELMDFELSFRTPYTRATDLMRDASDKNNNLLNGADRFYLIEFGLNYHVVDRKISSKSKFTLYSKNFQKYNRWKTMVPEHIYVPSNLRRIIGIHLGGTAYQSSFDVIKALENQGKSPEEMYDTGEGNPALYSNIKSQGFFIGGSLGLIKNIAINFEELYDQTANDLIFSVFVDILFHPFNTVEDLQFDEVINGFSGDMIETSMWGFRGGIEGKFNRKIGFGYRAELGIRPGIHSQGFYLMGVLSVPVFGFNLNKSNSGL